MKNLKDSNGSDDGGNVFEADFGADMISEYRRETGDGVANEHPRGPLGPLAAWTVVAMVLSFFFLVAAGSLAVVIILVNFAGRVFGF